MKLEKEVKKIGVASSSVDLSDLDDSSLRNDRFEVFLKNKYKNLEDMVFRMNSTCSELEKNPDVKFFHSDLYMRYLNVFMKL